MKPLKNTVVWLPLAMSISVVAGMLMGNQFSNQGYISDNDRKLNTILNLISQEYVDTINIGGLVEQSIPQILANLDPHTTYIPAKDLQDVNNELEGSFGGVGISFMVLNDTTTVVEVIAGGPSEKAGILAGDRIVKVDGVNFVGKSISDDSVRATLRGGIGSTVKLSIKRHGSKKLLEYDVVRGDIPVKSVDAAYMLDKLTGYIKVNKFGRTTYDEFLNGMMKLHNEGAKRYVIDLRGNAGGYMEIAILMANEFLPSNELIVYTKGREKKNDSQMWSDGNGSFQDAEVIVLIDEYSASASEIFAGAIQDNDRGLVVGRRSFGKGLVQRQVALRDSSAIRLTIARYYTPTGRCIQKDYKTGAYNRELYERYSHGELYSKDSIKVDKSKEFITAHGRTVYGGGGIVPDIFVPNDTTGLTTYYFNVANAGLLQKFAFTYSDINRKALSKLKDYKQFLRILPGNDAILNDFVAFAADNGVPARWYYINLSRSLIVTQIKALIARDIFGPDAFYPIYNRDDKNIEAALKAFDNHEAVFPITGEE